MDVFSRYLQAIPLKNKSAHSSKEALKSIFESNELKRYSRLFTDLGSEFYNKIVKKYLVEKKIKLYSNYSREVKSGLIERVLKTIKEKIYKYLTLNNTLKYIDVLPDIIKAYNETPHSSLGENQTPTDVHRLRKMKDIIAQFRRMYINKPKVKKPISSGLAVGDIVRLQLLSRTQFKFHKGYTISNTEELFRIKSVDKSQKIPVYYIEDLAGEDVKGIFYRDELIKTKLPEEFRVNILKSKVRKGVRSYYVSWTGYPSSFNSWIPASDLRKL